MLELIYENACPITLDITSALTALGKTTGDITDVIFIVKESVTDLDENAVISKTLVGGEITLQGTVYVVNILDTDFTGLTIGKNYIVAVGIKYTPLTKFKELDPDEEFLKVKQDKIRA